MHHQGTYQTSDGESVTSSVLWPLNPLAPAAAVDLSKKMCVAIYDRMQHLGFATVTRYPGGTYAGQSRNAYGIAGAGSILVGRNGMPKS